MRDSAAAVRRQDPAEATGTNGKSTFGEILKPLVGQVVTVINPTSYIPTLTGYRIDAETYKAKVLSIEDGTLRILIEFVLDPHKKTKEKAYQYIPIEQVRQVQISNSDKFVMI